MLDLLLHDGQIVDGTGAARRHGDVGIRDGRIVALGDVDETAARTIDVGGAIVAPGFVDVHTHYDAQVFWDPTFSQSSINGVTTVLAGNCGFSVAPLSDDAADYLMRMLARVEGMPLSSLQTGVPWDWKTMGDYLDRLDGNVGVNAGFMVGHSALRRVVMGEAASRREATADELAAMKTMLRESLAAGGLGFSSSTAQSHSDAHGDPVPSRHASDEELLELAAVCGEFEGTSLEFIPWAGGERFSEQAEQLMIGMSARAGRPLNWNLVQPRERNRPEIEAKLAISDAASRASAKVVGLVMPLAVALRYSFASGFVLDMLPGWGKLMALPAQDKLELLSNAARRADMDERAVSDPAYAHLAKWGSYQIYECFTPATKKYEGRRIDDIALEEHKKPFDALVDIVIADGLRTSFGRSTSHDTPGDWEARGQALRDPRVVIGASDAGAHLDMTDSFRYSTHILQEVVREHRLLTTEQAVRLMTEVPAALYGLRDRGVLREGAWADIVVFDEDSVGSGPLYMRADLPGGASRLFADSTGVEHVLVNGQPIVDHGQHTDARSGRVLRSGRDTSTPSLRLGG